MASPTADTLFSVKYCQIYFDQKKENANSIGHVLFKPPYCMTTLIGQVLF